MVKVIILDYPLITHIVFRVINQNPESMQLCSRYLDHCQDVYSFKIRNLIITYLAAIDPRSCVYCFCNCNHTESGER